MSNKKPGTCGGAGLSRGDNGRAAGVVDAHSKGQPAGRQVLFNVSGNHTASIDADGTLRKTVSGARHRIRVPVPAWAFDRAHVDAAAAAGVRAVEVMDRDDGAVYQVEFVRFVERAFPLDRGYGPQLALALAHWRVTRPARPSVPEPAPAPPAEQLSLL